MPGQLIASDEVWITFLYLLVAISHI